jgi:hypothetical protein
MSSSAGKQTWMLEELHSDGAVYLVDKQNQKVYTSVADQWPCLVGKLDITDGNKVRFFQSPPDLFSPLDSCLKSAAHKLSDLFHQLDASKSGKLKGDQLTTLVKMLLPGTADWELTYFRVLMDQLTEAEAVSFSDFVDALKDCVDVSVKV